MNRSDRIPTYLLFMLLVASVPAAQAQEGALDPSFADDGRKTTDIQEEDRGRGVIHHPNGKIYIVGFTHHQADSHPSSRDPFIARYHADGSLDTDFGSEGVVRRNRSNRPETFHDAALQDDGKIVAAGYQNNGSTPDDRDFLAVRYHTNGTVGDTFSFADFGQRDEGQTVLIQPDGKILVAGWIETGSGGASTRDFGVARYDTDGTLDSSFDGDGLVTLDVDGDEDRVRDLAVQSDGKILAGGWATIGGQRDFALARLNADGTLDLSFGDDGLLTLDHLDTGTSLLVQEDGKILFGGRNASDSNADFAVVRLAADGMPDSGFGTDGTVTVDFDGDRDSGVHMVQQADGKILVAGNATVDGQRDFALARLNVDGTLDASFAGDGRQTTDFNGYEDAARSPAIKDGKILVVGRAEKDGGGRDTRDIALARYIGDEEATADESLTCTWGGNNGDWETASNWDCGQVPAEPDTAVINRDVNVTHDGTAMVASFTLDHGNRAQFLGEGDLTVTDRLDWRGGTMGGTGTTTVGSDATLLFRGSAFKRVGSRTFNLQGTTHWTEGRIYVNQGASCEIHNSGTFEVSFDGQFGENQLDSPCLFRNTGTLRKTGGSGELLIGNHPRFNNEGTVEISSGTIRIRGNGTDTGMYTLAADAALQMTERDRTLAAEARVEGEGTVIVDPSDVTNRATWSPGSSSGILTVDSDFALEAEGTLDVDLESSTAPGDGHDQLAVTGNATLDGTLAIRIPEGYIPDPGDAFVVVTCEAGCAGTFSAVDEPDGYTFDVLYSENDVTLKAVEVLPVELTAFEATVDEEAVVLSWATASETDNAGFEVQVREHGSAEAWEQLAFVEGAGTTSEPQTYRYRAEVLDVGTHRFRLKQIDTDGTFEYSAEVEVDLTLAEAYRVGEVYPNPARARATLELAVREAQPVEVALYDLLGRRVRVAHDGELAANRTHRIVIEGRRLASGVYLVRLAGERFTATRRLTVVR